MSIPTLQDKYQASNDKLWQDVIDVASGLRKELQIQDRTIHSPNNGRGYRNMPNNPYGMAWVVKQYKGFGGGFIKQAAATAEEGTPVVLSASEKRLLRLKCGSIEVTKGPDPEMERWAAEGSVVLSHQDGEVRYWDYVKTASGVKAELEKWVSTISDLAGQYEEDAPAFLKPEHIRLCADFAKWFSSTFRVESSKATPKGAKQLKSDAVRFLDSLRLLGTPGGNYSNPRRSLDLQHDVLWGRIEPSVDQLISGFTSEGAASAGKATVEVEIKTSRATYLNKANISEKTFRAMVDKLEDLFGKLHGFHAKAVRSGMTVVFVGSSLMKVGGKYRTDRDEMWVKATPAFLKRGGGTYGSIDYIIVHEMGHRYERFNKLPTDFDREEWKTTRYSHNDGESFAELFALSQFDIAGPWDDKVAKFKELMQ